MKIRKYVKKDKVASFAFFFLLVLLVLVVFSNVFAPYDPNLQNLSHKLQMPSATHIFGTDNLGRDIFSRILFGGRITLIVSVLIVFLVLIIGFVFGSISGMIGGNTDIVLMRICDWTLSLPSEMVSLCIIGILGPSMLTIILALTIVRLPWYIRMIRSDVLMYKNKNYVLFSLGSGKTNYWVFTHHMIRPLMRLLLVYSTLDISAIVMSISALSFLGIGIQPPTAEWGRMLNDAKEVAIVEPWQMVPAGAAIFMVVAMLNYIGDVMTENLNRAGRVNHHDA